MHRFLLSPRWVALHVVTLAVVVAFVFLGWWQLKTFQFVDERQHRLDAQPVAISDLAAPGETVGDDAQGRQVTVSGEYATQEQVLVPNRVLNRVAGSYVVTPLVTPDGATVPVLRGWVDRSGGSGADPTPGPVTVTGVLVQPETERAAAVEPADVGPDEIPYIAPEQLVRQGEVAADSLYQGFVLLIDQEPAPAAGPQPLPKDAVLPGRGTSPWQNLSYWAQWWVFAGAVVVFWGSFVRTAVRDRRRAASPAASDAAS